MNDKIKLWIGDELDIRCEQPLGYQSFIPDLEAYSFYYTQQDWHLLREHIINNVVDNLQRIHGDDFGEFEQMLERWQQDVENPGNTDQDFVDSMLSCLDNEVWSCTRAGIYAMAHHEAENRNQTAEAGTQASISIAQKSSIDLGAQLNLDWNLVEQASFRGNVGLISRVGTQNTSASVSASASCKLNIYDTNRNMQVDNSTGRVTGGLVGRLNKKLLGAKPPVFEAGIFVQKDFNEKLVGQNFNVGFEITKSQHGARAAVHLGISDFRIATKSKPGVTNLLQDAENSAEVYPILSEQKQNTTKPTWESAVPDIEVNAIKQPVKQQICSTSIGINTDPVAVILPRPAGYCTWIIFCLGIVFGIGLANLWSRLKK